MPSGRVSLKIGELADASATPIEGVSFQSAEQGVMALNNRTEQRGFTVGYDIGIIGSWVRVLVGVGASLAIITTDLIGNRPPPAFWAGTALWLAGILAVYTVTYATLAPRVLPRLNPWLATVLLYGPAVVLPYVSTLPDTFRFALTVYIVISIALVVVMRYGGNAVVALPALLTRRRYVVYCPWNAVDLVDKAIEDSRWSVDLQGAAVKMVAGIVLIGVLTTGFLALGPTEPAVWMLTFAAAVAVPALWVLARRLFAARAPAREIHG